jgi:hypothetical protein
VTHTHTHTHIHIQHTHNTHRRAACDTHGGRAGWAERGAGLAQECRGRRLAPHQTPRHATHPPRRSRRRPGRTRRRLRHRRAHRQRGQRAQLGRRRPWRRRWPPPLCPGVRGGSGEATRLVSARPRPALPFPPLGPRLPPRLAGPLRLHDGHQPSLLRLAPGAWGRKGGGESGRLLTRHPLVTRGGRPHPAATAPEHAASCSSPPSTRPPDSRSATRPMVRQRSRHMPG